MYNKSTEKLAYSVKDALAATSVSRSFLYEEMSVGRLKTFHIGRRRLISAESLADWLRLHQAAQPCAAKTENPTEIHGV